MTTPKRMKKTKAVLTYDADMLEAALENISTEEISDAAEDLFDDVLICFGLVQAASPDATIEDALKLLPHYQDATEGMDRGDEEEPAAQVVRGEDAVDREFAEPGDRPSRRRRRER